MFRRRSATQPARQATVVTKALVRAAELWHLPQKDLAEMIGVSPATMSRLAGAERAIDLDSKEGELALLVLRVYRSLDALVGGDDAKARAWLTHENAHLGGVPVELMRRVEGLVRVVEYVDAMRAKV